MLQRDNLDKVLQSKEPKAEHVFIICPGIEPGVQQDQGLQSTTGLHISKTYAVKPIKKRRRQKNFISGENNTKHSLEMDYYTPVG